MPNVINNYVETEDGYSRSPVWNVGGEPVAALTPTVEALLGGQHVVYAMRLSDGIIKVGCTKNLANRSFQLHGKILGFRLGDFDDEAAVHATLRAHLARGREYYHPHPDVMMFVNSLRDEFGLPHVAA